MHIYIYMHAAYIYMHAAWVRTNSHGIFERTCGRWYLVHVHVVTAVREASLVFNRTDIPHARTHARTKHALTHHACR